MATQEPKTRKPRTPKKQNYDQVLQAGFALALEDRAQLVKELQQSVLTEVKAIQVTAENASKLIEVNNQR